MTSKANAANCDLFYQDGKGPIKEPYSGDEHRNYQDRIELPPELQNLMSVIRKYIKCSNHCVIPQKAQPHISHAILAVEEIGEGNIPRGINLSKDVIKRSYEQFENQDKSKMTIVNTVIRWVVPFILSLIGGGFVYYLIKVKGG